MSRIVALQRQLSSVTDNLRSCEAMVADDPSLAVGLQYDVKSLSKLRRQLQDEFTFAAAARHVDECRYRIFRDGDDPSLSPVASILSGFQHLVSLVFHSLQRKMPLGNGQLDGLTLATTSFKIGYTFEGSVGFVLTLPNDRLVTGMQTLVDESIDHVFALSKMTKSADVRTVANEFGRPVVKACYRWAKEHVENQLGSDVEWRRGKFARSKLFVQYQELQYLRQIIDETSEEKTKPFKPTGILTAANTKRKTFQFSIEGKQEIHGRFEDAIDAKHAALIPSRYHATMTKTTSVNYATGEEKNSYFLKKLKKVTPP